jgi:ketosteroid isomerase-like protein
MSRENVEVVRRLYEAFSRRDNESPFSVYDPDIEWDMSRSRIPLPDEDEAQALEAVRVASSY